MQIAIVGAYGNLGQDIIENINDINRSDISITGFDLEEHSADTFFNNGSEQNIQPISENSFDGMDVVVFAVPSDIVEKYVPIAIKSDVTIIDASGYLLSEKNPLVLYNNNISEAHNSEKIIINPNPLAQQLVSILTPLDKSAGIKKVTTSTYQSVSGRGKDAISELLEQSTYLLSGQEHFGISTFSTQIGFNCIPATSIFESEHSKDELQVITQTQILMKKQFPINATCVQMPTFTGYAQSVNIEFNNPISATKARSILELSDNIKIIDEPNKNIYSTPYGCAETNHIYVSRIRNGVSDENSINLWVVSDNLKISALNIVNIIKELSSH